MCFLVFIGSNNVSKFITTTEMSKETENIKFENFILLRLPVRENQCLFAGGPVQTLSLSKCTRSGFLWISQVRICTVCKQFYRSFVEICTYF